VRELRGCGGCARASRGCGVAVASQQLLAKEYSSRLFMGLLRVLPPSASFTRANLELLLLLAKHGAWLVAGVARLSRDTVELRVLLAHNRSIVRVCVAVGRARALLA
jgi:hypothetical protein